MTPKKWLFSFNGRISRKAYWVGMLISTLVVLIPIIVLKQLEVGDFLAQPSEDGLYTPAEEQTKLRLLTILLPFAIISSWINFAVTAKRLHDFNKSGWYCLYGVAIHIISVLIPPLVILTDLAFFVILIVIGMIKGTPNENKYGPAPLSE